MQSLQESGSVTPLQTAKHDRTATLSAGGRYKFCMALRTRRSTLLFECCEDAQRRLLSAPHLRPSRIDRIFISCLQGDQILGVPGAPQPPPPHSPRGAPANLSVKRAPPSAPEDAQLRTRRRATSPQIRVLAWMHVVETIK